ncbi:MAG: putative molybdenum carrier protein [Bacteroidetes bacterium]|nr:putative molybdenum carrier protein [Bacteroidota bacterium]
MGFLKKIISGGQTGTDRAALDVAINHGIPCGGWCPYGRKAEDGRIPDKYPLYETDTDNYKERTRLNIRDSDGTLILCPENEMDAGTKLTFQLCKEIKKPVYIADPADETQLSHLIEWLVKEKVHVLNIAGPRESNMEGIYEASGLFLDKLLNAEVLR